MLTQAIKVYRKVGTQFTPACPLPQFGLPSCSEYGLRATELHGSFRGGLMAYNRIMACGAIASAMAVHDGECCAPPHPGHMSAQVEDWCCGDMPINRVGLMEGDCCSPSFRIPRASLNAYDDCITCTPRDDCTHVFAWLWKAR